MLPDGPGKRQFYLGIDFIRKGTHLPKLQIWQERLLDSYPDVSHLALDSAGDINLMPASAVSIRIHSVGGWGAITMGKNLALTAFELLGWHVKANPKYGSEKKGQPTTFYGTLAKDPIRLNSELKHVDVVLSPDPNVFRHSKPLAGLSENGVFVIQSDLAPPQLWESLPASARREIEERNLQIYSLDAFKIAHAEASEPELRYRMQGAAFMGAFFRVGGLMEKEDLDRERLFAGIRKQLEKKFGHLGGHVVEDNLRVIQRGFDEAKLVDHAAIAPGVAEPTTGPQLPVLMSGAGWREGIGNPGRFWEQVGYLYKSGEDPIADPFAAISAIPAATSTIRDMTDVRFEVPEFVADRCTGCSQCWVVCPDAAIPGVVNTVDEVIDAAISVSSNGRSLDKVRQIKKHLANESRRIMKGVPFTTFAGVLSQAYKQVVDKLGWDAGRRRELDEEFAGVYSTLADFPLAKTAAFFDVPESHEKGTGGLLSITVNPEACKGCNLCIEVCPDEALITVKQNEEVVDQLRRNWKLWERLPDTDDRYINVPNLDEGIGVLSSLLLKKDNYRTMFGGDGACMGCGEKTGLHLILSAVSAVMQPRVEKHVKKTEDLMAGLDAKARELLASDADLDSVSATPGGELDIPLEESKREEVQQIAKIVRDLKDLHWRYTEGPSGKGRAFTGFSNSTGCSSVWGSTYPYNPYPFPWTNHLFQDAPSIAIGLFEGHMRKMSDGFIAVRRGELVLSGEYDAEKDESFFSEFDWRQFTDEEFLLCPPIFAVGGDGAMLDIGFQNASRLMASGKPIRIVVLDTQVYSNTGGQACTSGFTGQVSDMAAFGKAQHGKEETRKEMALIAMAHRGTFVLQSSQALPSHLLAGVIQGLNSRRPSVFILHCPCPPEHGLGDNQSTRASKLSLESRAFPFLVYDPDEGETLAECLNLDGNPAPEDTWPTYDLKYRDDGGNEQTMELPLTIADWAATEARFKKHFKTIAEDTSDEGLIPFHEYLELPKEERNGQQPFIYSIDAKSNLRRVSASKEIVKLAEDRLLLWHQLREMAGQEVSDDARGVVEADIEAKFDGKLDALKAEYEAKLAELRANFPQLVARRMAEGLLRAGNGKTTVADLLAKAQSTPGLKPIPAVPTGTIGVQGGGLFAAAAVVEAPAPPPMPAPAVAPSKPVREDEEEEGLQMEPYIESARCTTCNECTNLNRKLFAYNEKKQAFVKDATAGTFRELVMGAERCPVRIIHPGTPLNPKEKDLEKWVKRAEPFN